MSARAEAIRIPRPSLPPYAYWHLLSLDAPTVAVVWCCAFAAFAGVSLPLYVPLALAIATWMLYVADRLLDVRQSRSTEILRDRHWFHDRHATLFLAGLAIAALLLTWIVARDLPHNVRGGELVLGGVVLIYFGAIHFPLSRLAVLRQAPLKEIVVGIIFSFAVAIPTWASVRSIDLIVAVLGFAALCAINCLAIEIVEQPARNLWTMLGVCSKSLLLLATLSFGSAALLSSTGQRFVFLSIALSALLLFSLCRLRNRMSSRTFRIAADAALLTPMLFAPWHWMHR